MSSDLIPPATQTRAHVFLRIREGMSQLSRSKRAIFFITSALSLMQVVAFSVLLGLGHNKPCDKSLFNWLLVHVIRVSIGLPMRLYRSLVPKRSEFDTEEAAQARERERPLGNARLDRKIEFFSDLVAIFSLIWFLIGNIWLFSSHTCRATNPELYWGTLSALILFYCYVAEIVLLAVAVVFFLPLVIIGIRFFGLGQKKPDVAPLTKEAIDKIPLVIFTPKPEDDTTPPQTLPTNPPSEPTEPSTTVPPSQGTSTNHRASPKKPPSELSTPKLKKSRDLLRLFKRKSSKNVSTSQSSKSTSAQLGLPYPLHPIAEPQATCPICLCDYEPPKSQPENGSEPTYDLLRLLPCGHALHKDCVDEWFLVSGRCCVCQAEIFPSPKTQRTQTDRT